MESKKDNQIGVINEIGDMGLGFHPLSEEDQKILEQSKENKKEERESI